MRRVRALLGFSAARTTTCSMPFLLSYGDGEPPPIFNPVGIRPPPQPPDDPEPISPPTGTPPYHYGRHFSTSLNVNTFGPPFLTDVISPTCRNTNLHHDYQLLNSHTLHTTFVYSTPVSVVEGSSSLKVLPVSIFHQYKSSLNQLVQGEHEDDTSCWGFKQKGRFLFPAHQVLEKLPHRRFGADYRPCTGRLRQNNRYTPDVFPQVFSDVETGFMRTVYRDFRQQPTIASVGSCCLVGVIWRGSLEIANLGDSRAVLGSTGFGTTKRVRAAQLTEDHNCSSERIRSELQLKHCHDPHIVIESHGAWRVKGIIKVTRTIGDSYLKLNPFSYSGKYPRPSAVRGLLTQPVLSAKPGLNSMVIGKYDKFVIFVSHGFWEFMSNEEAISMVEGNGRHGIAKRLLRIALRRAARDGRSRYSVLLGVAQGRGGRRRFHDDMTVIVVFLDQRRWWWRWRQVPEMSYRGFSETVVATRFTEQPLDLEEEHSSWGLESPLPPQQPPLSRNM